MPVKECQIGGESGYKWGDQGKCYTGPDAKKKAIAQGIAIGDYFVNQKLVSIDFDDTLNTQKGQDLAKRLMNEGFHVIIITRRNRMMGSDVYKVAQLLGIPATDVHFTNGELKWRTVQRLGVAKHYDNNQNEIDKINELTDAEGILFK